MEDSKKPSESFEEGWSSLQTAVDKLISQIEGDDNSVGFTPEEYMSYYTTVYELCLDRKDNENSRLLYDRYKKVFEEYVNSNVQPSLQGKQGELLLRELRRRWSNHKIMTSWLSKIFNYLERYYLPRCGLPSLEESSFMSFYDLVYGEMNKQITDAILSLIDQERAGEQIDQTLVNNALGIYKEIGDGQRRNHAKDFAEIMTKHNGEFYYDGTSSGTSSSSYKDNSPKDAKLHDSPIILSKKINLKSSDGDVLEVDYAVALLLQTIEHIIKTNPDVNTIPLPKVSSKILAKVIEYCKKHTEAFETLDVNLKDWDADFVEVDKDTLFDLISSANYLNIRSLLDLACQKVENMIKGKTPEEIRKTFNVKNEFTLEEEEEIRRENQ